MEARGGFFFSISQLGREKEELNIPAVALAARGAAGRMLGWCWGSWQRAGGAVPGVGIARGTQEEGRGCFQTASLHPARHKPVAPGGILSSRCPRYGAGGVGELQQRTGVKYSSPR